MIRRLLPLVLLLVAAPAAQAESVYVSDLLRVGVRSEPASDESPLAVVTTGAELKVLERSDGYVKVRTEDGAVGWVSNVYVTAEPPARLRIAKLQEEHGKLQAELDRLRTASSEAMDENNSLQNDVADLRQENSRLHEQVSKLYAAANRARGDSGWIYTTAAMVSLFVFGIVLGALWYRRRVTDRLGGLRL